MNTLIEHSNIIISEFKKDFDGVLFSFLISHMWELL